MVIDSIETSVNGFNKVYTKIGPKLTFSIPNTSKDFQDFVGTPEKVLKERLLQDK